MSSFFEKTISDGEELSPVAFEQQLKAIHNLVHENMFEKTLEVGLGLGGSAASILSACQGVHVAMDPFQKKIYANRGIANLSAADLANRLEFYEDFSAFVLPKLYFQDRRFDFIYIDGDHKFDAALTDFFYASLLLELDGALLIDDTWMPAVATVVSYIETNLADIFERLPDPYLHGSLFVKRAPRDLAPPSPYRTFECL